jgi:hypothetical protein
MSDGQSLQTDSAAAAPAQIPSWKAVYEKTRRESDTEKLLTLIHATEAALYLRWQEVGESPADAEELAAMKAAAEELLAIKIQRLGWPNPCL